MHLRSHLLSAFVCLTLLVGSIASPLPRAHAAPASRVASVETSADGDQAALPGSCIGGLPPGADPGSLCCLSGYVFLDGQPVAGAKVTVTLENGSVSTKDGPRRSFVTTTAAAENNALPYYRLVFDRDLPLQAGTSIIIIAEYSGRRSVVGHKVLLGGQQVDLVFERAPIKFGSRTLEQDYKFKGQFWKQSPADQLMFPEGIAVDETTGTIYVAEPHNSSIQVFNSRGEFLRRWGTPGIAPGQMLRPRGIALDGKGSLYVADGRLLKYSVTGTLQAAWGDRPEDSEREPAPSERLVASQLTGAVAVSLDKSGNVYVLESGGALPGVRKLIPYDAETDTPEQWSYVVSREPGAAPEEFNQPKGIAVDGSGNIYVADTHSNRILKFGPVGGLLGEWSSDLEGLQDPEPGALNLPHGLSVDANDDLYVADTHNNRILKLDHNQNTWSRVRDEQDKLNDGLGPLALPTAVMAAANGHVYVADRNYRRILMIRPGGEAEQIVEPGIVANGQFASPNGVALDGQGFVYVADTGNGRIQKLTTGGVWTPWGSPPSEDRFGFPDSVAVDGDGDVYVTDSAANATNSYAPVRQFSSNGTPLRQYWKDKGKIENKVITEPQGISVDTTATPDIVYVADTGNKRIIKFTPAGALLDVLDGTENPAVGEFGNPIDVAVGQDGSVYVADTKAGAGRVVKIDREGNLSLPLHEMPTVAGVGGVGVDGTGNVFVSAADHHIYKFAAGGSMLATWGGQARPNEGEFHGPGHIVVDTDGTLFIVDQNNSRIQLFQPMRLPQPPIATIVQAAIQKETGKLKLRAIGGSDLGPGRQYSYEWQINSQPFTGADLERPLASLPGTGLHEIRLRIRDVNEFSAWVTTSITVQQPEPKSAWTMLLYLDGDYVDPASSSLKAAVDDLVRAIGQAPNSNVSVAVLHDGPVPGDSVRYLQQDGQLLKVPADATWPDEVDMGDLQTLTDFVTWGKREAPAEHYYLAIADHANGIDGIAWDRHNNQDSYLSNADLRRALELSSAVDGRPIDVLHLDGCLMGLLENAYQMRGLANYLISSQNLAWDAFAYSSYRKAIVSDMAPDRLATQIAGLYRDAVGALPYTIAALDLSKVVDVKDKTDALAIALRNHIRTTGNPSQSLRPADVQTFDADANRLVEATDEYIDLGHWADLIAGQVSDSTVRQAAAALSAALVEGQGLVLLEHHGSGLINSNPVNLNNARGVAIYFPVQPTTKTYRHYTQADLDFVRDTSWDTFLAADLDPLSPDLTEATVDLQEPLQLPERGHHFLPLVGQ